MSRVREIDLLRFIAAIAVVLFHFAFRGYAADNMTVMPYPWLGPIAQYGYLGVELFFLISGFVILMTASSGSLQQFVVSRISRLYPAFWACCTLTFIGILLIGGQRYHATWQQYLVNLTMMSGFLDVRSIDGAYWSLFVEIKFYAWVALILLLRQIHRAELFLFLWLAASIALDIYPKDRFRSALITEYAPYFIAGALCYLIHARGLNAKRFLGVLACWVLAMTHSLDALPGLSVHYGTHFRPVIVGAIVTLCFGALVCVAIRKTGLLGRRDWAIAGAITYPLYLLHQNLGFMLFNLGYGKLNVHLLFWGTLALMMGLAWVVSRYVERPFCPRLRTGLLSALALLRLRPQSRVTG